jgi:hypothetical protein
LINTRNTSKVNGITIKYKGKTYGVYRLYDGKNVVSGNIYIDEQTKNFVRDKYTADKLFKYLGILLHCVYK